MIQNVEKKKYFKENLVHNEWKNVRKEITRNILKCHDTLIYSILCAMNGTQYRKICHRQPEV